MHYFNVLDGYHSVGGELKVTETSFKGAANHFVKAGQDGGLKHTDLNAEFSDGGSLILFGRLFM